MKLDWNSMLDPILLYLLSLIAGTLWVIIPFRQQPARAPVPPPPVVRPDRLKPLPARDLARDRAALVQAAQQLRHEVESITSSAQASRSEQVRTAEQARREQQRLEQLQAELHQVNQRLAQAAKPQTGEAAPSGDLATLEAQLRERRTAAIQLEAELRKIQGPADGNAVSAPMVLAPPKGSKQVSIELVHNRVVPVDEEHFNWEQVSGRPLRKGIRKADGETIEEIRKPNSKFARLLGGMTSQGHYLTCFLNPDSFEVFREVRKVAQDKGILLGWEPFDGAKEHIYRGAFVKGPEVLR